MNPPVAAAGPILCDLCVIGAGAGGLSVAAGAAQMGARTVLIERDRMGGECLNSGCVPSKALLAAAKTAAMVREAPRFGIETGSVRIDVAAVRAHVRAVIGEIAPNDSEARFRGLGVNVLKGQARFTGPRTVMVGDTEVSARLFVIATGSRPAVPNWPGLTDVPYLTNETLFELADLPRHLIIAGGGPVGVEMAQAHRRLGAAVTLIEQRRLLIRDDPELVDVLRQRLIEDGVEVREGAAVVAVARAPEGPGGGAGIVLSLADGSRITGTHLLVAVGRRPGFDGLALDAAGVAHGPGGIVVDDRLRTTNRRIFVVGDAAGGPFFTHVAGYHASVVIRNALLRLPARVDYRALPWVTCTEPELAQVGLTEAAAREKFGRIAILRWPVAENDRAHAERHCDGLIKVVVRPDGRVVGAGVVGRQAGELIQLWTLAIAQHLKIGAVAGMVVPYPTLGEISKRVAGSYYLPMLFGERMKKLVRFLARLT